MLIFCNFYTMAFLHYGTVAVALVNQRLDYGNSTLVGITTYLVRRMQSALNAAARLIFNLRRSDHITDALVSLHWLRVSEQIDYKIAVLTYRVLLGGAPRYLGPFTSVVDLPSRRALRSAVTNRLVVPSVRLSTVGMPPPDLEFFTGARRHGSNTPVLQETLENDLSATTVLTGTSVVFEVTSVT